MPQFVGLAALAAAIIAPLWTARAILGAILALLFRDRVRRERLESATPTAG
jgi:hypothetical protein